MDSRKEPLKKTLDPEAAALSRALRKPLPEIPCKYLYDELGSTLYEQITHEPEYYQTRTELRILEACAGTIAQTLSPREYVELGSGSGRKTHLLLDALKDHGLERVALLDISREMLNDSVARLRVDYPGLSIRGLVSDFLEDLSIMGLGHASTSAEPGGRLVTFLAGTIGNLHPSQVAPFLTRAARQLQPGDGMLVGIDLIKDPARLEAAYNDAAGVTAAFNTNILSVLNDRFGTDFPVEHFEHRAFYDAENAWIDIRLRATRACRVRSERLGIDKRFEPGSEIRTELSCKYSRESFGQAVEGTGLEMQDVFTDEEDLFADVLLVPRAS